MLCTCQMQWENMSVLIWRGLQNEQIVYRVYILLCKEGEKLMCLCFIAYTLKEISGRKHKSEKKTYTYSVYYSKSVVKFEKTDCCT